MADDDDNATWINPPAFGASGETVSWPIGSSQTLKWSADYDVQSILLWPDPQQGTEYQRILDGASDEDEYTWTVSTRFALSNSFFFGLYNDTPTTSSGQGASFKSKNFNIVSAVSSSSTSTTSTRSSTSTRTSTSSTTTRTRTSSTTTSSGFPVSSVTTTPSSTSTENPTDTPSSTFTESPTDTPTSVGVASPTSTGLARSTVVGLGVGIGIGIPLILVLAILVGFRLRKSKRTKKRIEPNGYGIDYSDQVEVPKLPGVDYSGGMRYGSK
ncbi:MAG: hypothetical protein Q9187_000289 [Circinaria calcarea]